MMHRLRLGRAQRISKALLGGLFSLLLAAPGWAREQLTIQKSGANTQPRAMDSYLDLGNPNATNGNATTVRVQAASGATQRTIVLFDLSAVANAGIKAATLTLHVVTPPAASRTYDAHAITSFFFEPSVSWNSRLTGTAWTAAGGDFNPAITAQAAVTNSSTSVSWTITSDVQAWYNGTTNFGTLIQDHSEDASGNFTVFSSKEDATAANRPQLVLTFVQNVASFSATPGNAAVTLNWTYPAAIGTVLEANTGVLILRRANLPVDKNSFPADGTSPALCASVGSGTVVFSNSTGATSFVDNSGNDTCGAPTNGTMWFYKIFVRDSANNYSHSVVVDGSTFTKEISAMPNSSAGTQQNSVWMAATHSTTLAAPALIPGSVIMAGSQSNLFFGVNANTGLRSYPPVSIGGSITARAPIVDSAVSSLGQNVAYVAGQDGLVYCLNTDTGQIVWVVNPTGLSTNAFQGGAAVYVKSIGNNSYTRATDLVVVGTRNAGTTSANIIVAMDANTGATVWQVKGSVGQPSMDIVNSTPTIDYVHNAIWVTTRSAGGTGQPSLWKINPNTGAVIATLALSDIDSSPSLTQFSDALFVGTNSGLLYAINPSTAASLASFNGGDGSIIGFPVPATSATPFNVIFSSQTKVQSVNYSSSTQTFGAVALWTTPITTPSTPIALVGLGNVFVGSGDGKIHELNLSTGVDVKDEVCNTGQPGIVGDPSLDLVLNRIYVSTTDQRAYSFAFPF